MFSYNLLVDFLIQTLDPSSLFNRQIIIFYLLQIL